MAAFQFSIYLARLWKLLQFSHYVWIIPNILSIVSGNQTIIFSLYCNVLGSCRVFFSPIFSSLSPDALLNMSIYENFINFPVCAFLMCKSPLVLLPTWTCELTTMLDCLSFWNKWTTNHSSVRNKSHKLCLHSEEHILLMQ